MNQISLLVELQNLDMRSDENAAARAALETKLADASALASARVALETFGKQAHALQAQLRALELETNGLAEKLKQVNERLYSGRITNAKELAGLNQDEKMLQRRKSELEDKELALMEQIENADAVTREKRAAYEKLAAETNARNEKERAELQKLDALDPALARKRDAIRAQLPAETLRAYDDLRRTKKGRAVAHIKVASCAACGYAVPSGLISRARLGNELVFCANCGRILAS
jgi:predicted  nucleic acid-binding Zn-ribbon protein